MKVSPVVSLPLSLANSSNGTTGGTLLPDPHYCKNFKLLGNAYKQMHGYTSVTVCTFGVLANTLNLIVLTRKELINSTNAILTGLALADLLTMSEYIPFAVYMNFLPDQDGTERKTYPWAVYVLVHSNFSQVCHTISIWLTLTLAVWRYIMISMPLRCKTLCSMERAKWLIASAYLISPLLCLPNYFTFSISAITPSTAAVAGILGNSSRNDVSDLIDVENGNVSTLPETASLERMLNPSITPAPFLPAEDEFTTTTTFLSEEEASEPTKYVVNLSTLAKQHPLLMTTNFWFYSVVLKLLPCVMLTYVSLGLINSLLEAKRRKEKLFGVHITGLAVVGAGNARINSDVPPSTEQHPGSIVAAEDVCANNGSRSGSFTRPTGELYTTTRTTRMLLAVLLLFLITEFPQGILALLSDLLGDRFFKECYYPLSDLMDFVALLNSSINFILYCSMSTRFRDVFCQVFHLTPIIDFCAARRRQRQSSIASHTTQQREPNSIVLATISGQLSGTCHNTECDATVCSLRHNPHLETIAASQH